MGKQNVTWPRPYSIQTTSAVKLSAQVAECRFSVATVRVFRSGSRVQRKRWGPGNPCWLKTVKKQRQPTRKKPVFPWRHWPFLLSFDYFCYLAAAGYGPTRLGLCERSLSRMRYPCFEAGAVPLSFLLWKNDQAKACPINFTFALFAWI